MIPRRCHGFILTMVLISLTVVALIMTTLTQNTQLLIIQTHRQQIAAINRNLILSARTWARQHREPHQTPVILDANDLSSRPVQLSLKWLDPNHIEVNAQATWSTLNLKQQQNLSL